MGVAGDRGSSRWPVVLAVRWLVQAAPRLTAAVAAVMLAAFVLSVATVVVNGLLVGAVPAVMRDGMGSAAGDRLWRLLAAAVAVTLAMLAVGQVQAALVDVLASTWSRWLRLRAMGSALGPPGIAHLEDPSYADELTLGMSTPGSSPFEVPRTLAMVTGARLQGLGATVILFGFAPWAPLLVAAALALQNSWGRKELDLLFHFYGTTTPETRRSAYYRRLATQVPAAKELRLFGLADFVVDRFSGHWLAAMEEVWTGRRALRWRMIAQTGLEMAVYAVVFVAVVRAGVRGDLSLAAVTIHLQAIRGMRNLGFLGDPQYILRNSAASLPHLDATTRHPSARAASLDGAGRPSEGAPHRSVRFQGVGFAYPGTDRPVFEDLTFELEAGRSTALVGANGAGKTTLVKLLARLYDPDTGAITVDGTDLRTFDPPAWRQRVSVVFQDFVQYPFTAYDNVALGDPAATRDEVLAAAAATGADKVVAGLADGWDTVLWREAAGGAELSGGQWQRLAVARAVLAARRGGVLVLDEPTANLDVRAEAEVFDRFLELTAGTTTLLISHRFSTVRHAERIVVLDGGRVVEQGGHDELVAGEGRYARMFRLQASRFVAEGEPEAAGG